MMKKTNTLLASAVAAGVLMLAAQGAAAADKAKSAPSANAAASAIEQRMKMMEEQMQMMKSELTRVRSEAAKPSESVAKLDERLSKQEATAGKRSKDNLVFFRGGYAHNDTVRDDLLTGGQVGGTAIPNILGMGTTDNDGWYMGAGFDFSLTDNTWGLLAGTPLSDTEVAGELMFEYKDFGTSHAQHTDVIGGIGVDTNPLCATVNAAVAGAGVAAGSKDCNSVTTTQLTLTASPKLKFMKGSNFRPWVVPFGFGLHVISPPSNGVTVTAPGVMFAAGADYRLWKEIFVGVDARYHLVGNALDGVDIDGMTAGGYLGIGF
jgi:opacity protein-like surface antigen